MLRMEPPGGFEQAAPELGELKKLIWEQPRAFWIKGDGWLVLQWQRESGEPPRLKLVPKRNYGFYVEYYLGSRVWLILQDKSKLLELTTIPEEWEVSVGLLASIEATWKAVEAFYRTGERSPELTWIEPSELPRGSNW